MISGSLDQRISFTKVKRVFDGRGGWTEQETPIGSFWAAITPVGIEEQSQYRALNVSVNLVVIMRYHPEITQGVKFTLKGKRYEVRGVLNPGFQNEYLKLVVGEV